MTSIDPAELEVCLRVLAQVEDLPAEHDDAVRVRRATAKIFKAAKKFRKSERKAAITANDRAVTALTATGSPDRIDDETQGLPLVSNAQGATAGDGVLWVREERGTAFSVATRPATNSR